VIAEPTCMRGGLAEVTMPDELIVELTQLTGDRTDLMADWVGGINQLRSLLGSIFATLEAAFDYPTRTPLILVAGMCTLAEIRVAGIEGVSAHLVDNQARRPGIAKTAATAVALANDQRLALPGETGTAALVMRTAIKLLERDREIKDLDKTITDRFRGHPYAQVTESLPGFGPSAICRSSKPTPTSFALWGPDRASRGLDRRSAAVQRFRCHVFDIHQEVKVNGLTCTSTPPLTLKPAAGQSLA
jgi:hypothetical protein